MSNLDRLWTEQDKQAALKEGWELAYVVNEGRPVRSAYLDIFDKGPRFATRIEAVKFVIGEAQKRSKLHIAALSACSASRVNAAQAAPQRKS